METTPPDSSPPVATAPAPPRKKRRRWWRIVLIALAVIVGGLWLFQDRILAAAEKKALAKLADEGVFVSFESRSWLPWKGLEVKNVTLYETAEKSARVAELSNLRIELSWGDIWGEGAVATNWKTYGATLTLRDAKGEVTFTEVESALTVRAGSIRFSKLAALREGVRVDATGEILWAPGAGKKRPADHRLTLELRPVRNILSVLKVEAPGKPVMLTGFFRVDSSNEKEPWTADLAVKGADFLWHGWKMQTLDGVAKLGASQLKASGRAEVKGATVAFELERDGDSDEPTVITARATDASRGISRAVGRYQPDRKRMVLSRVEGTANLMEILQNYSQFPQEIADTIRIVPFPETSAKNVVIPSGGEWSVEALEMKGAAALAVIKNAEAPMRGFRAEGSYRDGEWEISKLEAEVFGGRVRAEGRYSKGLWHDGVITVTKISMGDLPSSSLGEGMGLEKAILSGTYRGALGQKVEDLTGAGRLMLTNAPVVHVPLLDQTYSFFGALVPTLAKSGAGEMEAAFTAQNGRIAISSFKATGDSATVTATGVIDLPRDRVQGEATGRMRGAAGLITRPLTQVMEMEITGTLSDIQVRPNPLKGALSAAEGVGNAAVDAAKTTTGILREGAKVPMKLLNFFKRK